jgi:hypothetical protein
MARVYPERVVEPRRELLKTVIERGIARGDLRSDTDVQVLHEFLSGRCSTGCLLAAGSWTATSRRASWGILEGFAPR